MKNILKSILIVVLISTTTLSILIFTMLYSTKKIINKDNFISIVDKIDVKDILTENVKNKIYQVLKQAGMDAIYVDKILENEDIKRYFTNYIYDSTKNIIEGKEVEKIDITEMTDKIIIAFNSSVEDLNTSKISKEEQNKIIEKIKQESSKIETLVVDKITNEINDTIKKDMDYITNNISKIEKIYSLQNIVLILIIIQLIIITLIELKQFKFLKYIAIPFLINAILLYLINLTITKIINNYYPKELEKARTFITTLLNNIKNIYKDIEIKYILFFIITIIIYMVIYTISKKKDDIEDDNIDIQKINIESKDQL